MAFFRWQKNIVDEAGSVLSGASVEIRDESTGALVNLFEDIDGVTPKGNPLTTDSSGYAFAYLEPARLKITASKGTFSFSLRDVLLPEGPLGSDSVGAGASLVSMEGGPSVENGAVRRVDSLSELRALPTVDGKQASLSGDRSGIFKFSSSNLSSEVSGDTLEGIYVAPSSDPTGASGAWVRQYTDEINLLWFGAVADYDFNTGTGTDNKAAILAAIAAVGGVNDITSNYIYEPVPVLRIPEGDYGVELTGSDRFLIDKNNVKIVGDGVFNTTIIHMGSANVAEMFRFKEAYACELSSLTIDGGLPFTPDGTETYGVDTMLTLDQCAHFESKHLNITNYRLRGKQCIHLWESWFDDLRIFNGGFFGTGAVPSAGIAFDSRGQESTFFPGSESNQIKYGKVAFGTVGTLVRSISPCFNISFDFVVAEGRTFSTDYTSLGESKWIVDGLTSGLVVHHAWSYHHDQPFNNNATLFELVNAGPNCKFLNYQVYQEIPGGSGNFLEVPNIINNTSAYPVEVNLAINDVDDATTALFNGASAGSMITGRIDYRNDSARTFEDFIGADGQLYFSGALTFIAGAFTSSTPDVYTLKGKAETHSQIDGSGLYEEFAIRAAASYNGNTDTLNMGKNLSATRDSVGQYTFTFDQSMPDSNYAVVPGFQLANLGDNIEVTGQSAGSFSIAIRDGGGTFHDSGLINLTVVR